MSLVGSIRRSIITCRPSSLLNPRIISRGCIWGEKVEFWFCRIDPLPFVGMTHLAWFKDLTGWQWKKRIVTEVLFVRFSFDFNLCSSNTKGQLGRPCRYWDKVHSPWHPKCKIRLQSPGGRRARYQVLPEMKRANVNLIRSKSFTWQPSRFAKVSPSWKARSWLLGLFPRPATTLAVCVWCHWGVAVLWEYLDRGCRHFEQ